ncbi:MAG: alginate export family protein [Desulfobulbaceae bacterium]|nr:alginate export family protein [Desulfobulbaceae bacterium]
MKKTLTAAALSSVLVLGLAVASQAADTTTTGVTAKGASVVTLDGNVRHRGTYRKSDITKDRAGQSSYDSKIQLGTKAKVSDQATGYIKLESGANSNDVEGWGNGDAAGLHSGGDKNGSVTILDAWLDYQPGAWGIKAGHMPLSLGNKVFYDHTGSGDDALVFYANPTEATHIAALTIKFDEQTAGDSTDDLDGYQALVTHKVSDTLNVGANWMYMKGGSNEGVSELLNGMSFSNIGLNADGKVGAIAYMADVEFQFGDFSDNGTITSDAEGWATKLGADYDLGAGKVGLVFGYGSGQDLQSPSVDTERFVNFLTDTVYETILVGYRIATPGQAMYSGLSNLTLVQLKGSTKTVCPLTGKDLSLLGSLSYMQTSEDVAAGTSTTGVNYQDEVGTEVDLIATWALTPGLSYKVEAAYLFVGDAYDTLTAGVSSDPDDAMFLRHGLDLKF